MHGNGQTCENFLWSKTNKSTSTEQSSRRPRSSSRSSSRSGDEIPRSLQSWTIDKTQDAKNHGRQGQDASGKDDRAPTVTGREKIFDSSKAQRVQGTQTRDRGPPLTGATVAMKATMPLTRTAVVMKATTNDQSNSDNEANATNGANNSDDQGSTTNEESNSGDEANDISDASKSDDTRVLDKSMLSSGPSLVSAFSQCYSVGLRCLWTLCLERTCVPWSHVAQH